jgi:hypothetical protein
MCERPGGDRDFHSIACVKFLHQVGHIVFDGSLRNPQTVCDLLIGFAGHQKARDLTFSDTQFNG